MDEQRRGLGVHLGGLGGCLSGLFGVAVASVALPDQLHHRDDCADVVGGVGVGAPFVRGVAHRCDHLAQRGQLVVRGHHRSGNGFDRPNRLVAGSGGFWLASECQRSRSTQMTGRRAGATRNGFGGRSELGRLTRLQLMVAVVVDADGVLAAAFKEHLG